ncbi:hypothetical protein [Nocardia sp. NPDC004260]
MPIATLNAPAVDRTAARMLAAHRPEMELLAEIGGRPRLINTGGGCMAIEADAGPAADPLGTLYLLITTEDCQRSLNSPARRSRNRTGGGS